MFNQSYSPYWKVNNVMKEKAEAAKLRTSNSNENLIDMAGEVMQPEGLPIDASSPNGHKAYGDLMQYINRYKQVSLLKEIENKFGTFNYLNRSALKSNI